MSEEKKKKECPPGKHLTPSGKRCFTNKDSFSYKGYKVVSESGGNYWSISKEGKMIMTVQSPEMARELIDSEKAKKKPGALPPIVKEIYAAEDFETFKSLTYEYAKMLVCTVNEKEIEMLAKKKEKVGMFYCPCVMFREELVDKFRCPCKGDPKGPNFGHLKDIAQKGACYCKLYIRA